MHDFTPTSALVGGALIAASLGLVLITMGRVVGLAGAFAGFLRGTPGDWAWRAWFLGGMLGVGLVFSLVRPETFDHGTPSPLWLVGISGALVGVGTRLANGCTSGHGLCGTSRLSKRSIVATLVFFGTGVVVATLVGSGPR